MKNITDNKVLWLLVAVALIGTAIYLLRFHKKTKETQKQTAAVATNNAAINSINLNKLVSEDGNNVLHWGAGTITPKGEYISNLTVSK